MAVTTTSLLEAVAAGCPASRAGNPGDRFAGRDPAVVAVPSSAAEVADVLRASAPSGAAVAVRGGGTKTGLGPPPRSLDLLIETGSLDRIVEYDPGDLVVRAQAGVRVETLQELLGGSGQWLALDPPERDATLGGLVAANSSGPRRHRYGTVRDLLIGAAFVLADGTGAHAGGKVVKNVAGYDLCKLLTGSFGTLAVITEVTFRLHPRPAAGAAVAVAIDRPAAAGAALRALLATHLEPSAVEVDLDGGDGRGTLVVLFEGLPAAVEHQARAAQQLLDGDSLTGDDGTAALPAWWGRHPWTSDDVGLRIAYQPAALEGALAAVSASCADAERLRVRGRAAVGVLEIGAGVAGKTISTSLERLRRDLEQLDGTAVVTHLPGARPGAEEDAVDRWGPVRGLPLMRAVKDRFDPDHRLAPGRFVGGI